jgi:hypothetical protein
VPFPFEMSTWITHLFPRLLKHDDEEEGGGGEAVLARNWKERFIHDISPARRPLTK